MGDKHEQIVDAQKLLKEYYTQSMEDCRIIGNQKYMVYVTLATAIAAILAAIFYVETTSYDVFAQNPLLLVISGIASLIIIFNLRNALFLGRHLSCMVDVTMNIESLQRDLLFREMGTMNCFSWNKILGGEKDKFKMYLQKQYAFPYSIKITDKKFLCNHIYSFDIYPYYWLLHFPWDFSMNLFKFKEKHRHKVIFSLNPSNCIAVLTIDNVEVDRFEVNREGQNLMLLEPELKHRFRDITPHIAVCNSIKLNKMYALLMLLIVAILIVSIFMNLNNIHLFFIEFIQSFFKFI
jgi:hypothetical protein